MKSPIVFVRNGSFTNLVICIYVLKIPTIKFAHTLKIECFMTCNNQFCFCLKVSQKLTYVYGAVFSGLFSSKQQYNNVYSNVINSLKAATGAVHSLTGRLRTTRKVLSVPLPAPQTHNTFATCANIIFCHSGSKFNRLQALIYFGTLVYKAGQARLLESLHVRCKYTLTSSTSSL